MGRGFATQSSEILAHTLVINGKNTNYLVVVIIIFDTSQNCHLDARQVEAVSLV